MTGRIFCVLIPATLAVTSLVRAQADTSVQLPPVEVTALSPGEKGSIVEGRTWSDSTLRSIPIRDLGNFLSENSTVFIKQFGGVSSATASIRGGNASQIAVLWNGLNIQNNMLGLSDLSLLSTAFFDDVSLEYGGNTALHGSGALSGSILLNSRHTGTAREIALAGVDAGSFGALRTSARVYLSPGQWTANTRLLYSGAENNFTYPVAGSDKTRTQDHARFRQGGIMQDVGYHFSENHALKASVWWQAANRQLPPTRVQNSSDAVQEDESLRAALEYVHERPKSRFTVRTGVLKDRLDFLEPKAGIDSRSRQSNAFVIGEARWAPGKHWVVMTGINHHWITAAIDNYPDGEANQRRAAVYGSANGLIANRLEMEVSARGEMIDGTLIPPAAAVGMRYQLSGKVKAHVRVSRDYRIPGLNDTHWLPGGNRDLQTERSWSEEAGARYESESFTASLTAFNRNTNNWILWAPVEGQNYWGAFNLTEVWSRGLDLASRWRTSLGAFHMTFDGSYAFIRSTNQVAIEKPMLPEGRQLIYTPKHQGNLGMQVHWRCLQLRYVQVFRGEVSTEFASALPAYSTGNLNLQGTFNTKKTGFTAFLEINNIWDVHYEVVARRPMPGRNFRIGITSIIKK